MQLAVHVNSRQRDGSSLQSCKRGTAGLGQGFVRAAAPAGCPVLLHRLQLGLSLFML